MKKRQRQPGDDTGWQEAGYHMETSRCESAPPVNDQNDTGFQHSAGDGPWRQDPFEDGAVDRGLSEERSEELDKRQSPFWQSQPTPPPEQVIEREQRHKSVVLEKVRRKIGVNARVLIYGLCSLLAVILLYGGYCAIHYRITEIDVEGNSYIPKERVIELSGLKVGTNLLTLDEKAAERIGQAISRERYLVFVGLKKYEPNRVVIHVRERTPVAYMNTNGIVYVLDASGMVLEEDRQGTMRPVLMRLEGLDVRTCRVGSRVDVNQQLQFDIYMTVSMEAKAMSLGEVNSALYVTDTNNLYLVTADGFTVRLGNSSRIHAKLRSMNLVREALVARGEHSGTIDVSTPAEPTWIPEAT